MSVSILTSSKELDDTIKGLVPPRLVVLAGRPATGKTELALKIALNISRIQKISVVIFSLEHPKDLLIERIKHIDPEGIPENFWIEDEPGITLDDFSAKAHFLVIEHNVKIIILDYIQLLSIKRLFNARFNKILKFLKDLSRELDVVIVAVTQLGRWAKIPQDTCSGLMAWAKREKFANEADTLLLICRDDIESDFLKENRRIVMVKHLSGS